MDSAHNWWLIGNISKKTTGVWVFMIKKSPWCDRERASDASSMNFFYISLKFWLMINEVKLNKNYILTQVIMLHLALKTGNLFQFQYLFSPYSLHSGNMWVLLTDYAFYQHVVIFRTIFLLSQLSHVTHWTSFETQNEKSFFLSQ